jgi:hypothetical protein
MMQNSSGVSIDQVLTALEEKKVLNSHERLALEHAVMRIRGATDNPVLSEDICEWIIGQIEAKRDEPESTLAGKDEFREVRVHMFMDVRLRTMNCGDQNAEFSYPVMYVVFEAFRDLLAVKH